MLTFHATIHARPAETAPGPVLHLAGADYVTLAVSPEALGATTFACSFEEARAKLAVLERIYCEPDGSFVWVSSQFDQLWQVDGNLYDRAERVLFVDLKGSCPPKEFDRLLRCFGWPETPVMFQLVREAVLLGESEFRRWAGKASRQSLVAPGGD